MAAATPGDFGLILVRRLALLTKQGTSLYTNEWNAFRGGLPAILPNACLYMAGISSTTTTPAPTLEYMFVKQ